jgi:TfoX/Sxy family transcriptional regulator of competence genes
MSYDEGLLARCLDLLPSLGAGSVRHKNVFGMRGLLRGKTMFAAVGEESMIVKLRPHEYEAALQKSGVSAFSPGGQKLGTWVELADDVVADDPELRDWLEAALRAVR